MTKIEAMGKLALGGLYVLAAPIFAAKWLLRSQASFSRAAMLRDGFMDCPHCQFRNPLDILAHCRRCGRAEFGSRLYCSGCKQVLTSFPCDRCTATIEVQ